MSGRDWIAERRRPVYFFGRCACGVLLMAQDVVTARDVAAPTDVTLQLPDASIIGTLLDDALAKEDFDRATYSPSVQYLLQLAWAVAVHKRNRHVTIHHLAYALVFEHRDDGLKLAEYLGADVDAFAVGCILQILPLGIPVGDHTPTPAVGAVRWLGEAVALARGRGEQGTLLPEDLVHVVLDDRLPQPERDALRKAARVGKGRLGVVLGKRPTPANPIVTTSSRDIIKHMEEVERGPDNADLLTRIEEIDERHSAIADAHTDALGKIEAAANERMILIEQRVAPIQAVLDKLEAIDGHVAALVEAQPRPPSVVRLATAIVSVLALGAVAGLTLSHWQPGSHISQAVSVSSK